MMIIFKNFFKKNKLFMFILKFFFPYLRDYGRPWYRHLLYRAFIESKKLNYTKCTIIEFGVGKGDGIRVLEKISSNIKKKFNFEINIIGFDSLGLKNLTDYKDVKFKWKEGLYSSDEKNLKNFKNAKIIIGDVKDTLSSLNKSLQFDSPISGLIFDLNLYTSTVSALEIFNINDKYLLPRIDCYFDDSNTIEYIGERLAIKEFNNKNINKKISQNPQIKTLDNINGWAFYEFHNFQHNDYNKFSNFYVGK